MSAILFIVFISSVIAGENYDAKSISEAEHAKALDPTKITLRGDTEGNKVNFNVGEEMTFKFSISYGNQSAPERPYKIYWKRFGDDGKDFDIKYPPVDITPDKPIIFKTSAHRSGFIIVRGWLLDSNGNDIKVNNYSLMFTGALGAEIEKLKPRPEPKDFDQFWQGQLEDLQKIPMKPELTQINSDDPRVTVWKFSIPVIEDTQATGYLYMPVNAKSNSLPAMAVFNGYGRPENVKINYGRGYQKIVIVVSRYGSKQGESKDYYQKFREMLEKDGKIGFVNNEDRETSCFKNMVLRDYRALQFLKSRPEWNSKDLTVFGGSMGGGTSILDGGIG